LRVAFVFINVEPGYETEALERLRGVSEIKEAHVLLLERIGGIERDREKDRIRELVDMFGFEEMRNQLVKTLSSGWTKKAMISAALLHNPSILFLDEVALGLDPQSAIALRNFTRSLCEQGVIEI
jgi:ABC-2 type transport system ATP-binding protein